MLKFFTTTCLVFLIHCAYSQHLHGHKEWSPADAASIKKAQITKCSTYFYRVTKDTASNRLPTEELVSVTATFFNTEGSATKYKTWDFSPDKKNLSMEHAIEEVQYKSDGSIKLLKGQKFSFPTDYKTKYKYNKSGLIVQTLYYSPYYQLSSSNYYAYDGHEELVEKKHYFRKRRPIYSEVYQYNKEGKKVKTLAYNALGKLDKEWQYLYTSDNQKLLSEVCLDGDANIIYTLHHRYNSAQQLVESYKRMANGELDYRESFAYDKNGQLVEKLKQFGPQEAYKYKYIYETN